MKIAKNTVCTRKRFSAIVESKVYERRKMSRGWVCEEIGISREEKTLMFFSSGKENFSRFFVLVLQIFETIEGGNISNRGVATTLG